VWRTICIRSTQLLAEGYAFTFGQALDKPQRLHQATISYWCSVHGKRTHIFTTNGLNNIVWRRSQELRDY
jgi:hypothetical protein